MGDCGTVSGVVHGDCAQPSFQNLLLYVRTVVATMWFSWLCPWEPPAGSMGSESNRQLPCSPPELSVTLLATVTTATGPTGPHLRHWPPETTRVGASVPVSRGEMRQGWCLVEGGGPAGEAGWPRGSRGVLTAHCLPAAPERHSLRSVDHRLRLFLDVEVFTDAQEEFQCYTKVCASLALSRTPDHLLTASPALPHALSAHSLPAWCCPVP